MQADTCAVACLKKKLNITIKYPCNKKHRFKWILSHSVSPFSIPLLHINSNNSLLLSLIVLKIVLKKGVSPHGSIQYRAYFDEWLIRGHNWIVLISKKTRVNVIGHTVVAHVQTPLQPWQRHAVHAFIHIYVRTICQYILRHSSAFIWLFEEELSPCQI